MGEEINVETEMLIIGERINTSRTTIEEAVEKKDAKVIQDEAKVQIEAGAQMLEVNCGTRVATEPEDMSWLVRVVQEAVDIPLSIDSPNPKAIEAGLAVHKGRAMVNSITAIASRADGILPLVKKYNSQLVALLMDERGMPKTSEEMLTVAKKIMGLVAGYGVKEDDLYLDPLVRPVSTEPKQVGEVLKTIRSIRSLGRVKSIVGLSNISFGLPKRSLINRTFLALALEAGLDAAIIDPTDPQMIATLKASNALLGKDEYCLEYIAAHREGKLRET